MAQWKSGCSKKAAVDKPLFRKRKKARHYGDSYYQPSVIPMPFEYHSYLTGRYNSGIIRLSARKETKSYVIGSMYNEQQMIIYRTHLRERQFSYVQ